MTCAEVPNYSVYLYVAGVCNPNDTLASYGTFLSDAYNPKGTANRKPKGVHGGKVTLSAPTPVADGEAVARLKLDPGARYRASKHVASILLVDADTGQPVSLDYRNLTTPVTDAKGNITEVHVRIPAGTTLPAAPRGLRDRRRVPARGAGRRGRLSPTLPKTNVFHVPFINRS